MSQECCICQKNLTGRPKIQFEDKIYCYICAKEVVGAKDSVAVKKHANDLKEYEAKAAKHKTWEETLASFLPSKTTQKCIIVGVAIGFAVFLENPVLFLPGLLIGLIVKHFYVQSQRSDWVRNHPEPEYPSYPSGDYASSRIQLVGGVRGKPLSGSHRKKILERDGYQCQSCGQVFPAEQLEVHHIKPQAKGGKHFSTNLITLCYDCHLDEGWFGHSHKMRKWHRK